MLKIVMILGGVVLRLTPHLPNFTPISAIAIFSGAYLNKKYAIVIPIIAIAVSDYLLLYIDPFGNPQINFSNIYPITKMFHSTFIYVYVSFAVSGLIGIWIKKHNKPSNIIIASFLASLQFYLITNFGVWQTGMYSRNLNGLLESYIMGLPFFKYTMLGDLFYTTVFFGTYILAQRVDLRRVLVR